MLKKLLVSLALSVSLFAQHDASINLNSDDIEVNGNIDIGELNQSDYPNIYFLTLGFLDVDNKEPTDPLLQAGFKLRQDVTGVQGLRFGLGFKGTYTEVGRLNRKHAAIPLGVELAYTLPIDSTIPVIISGSLDYAPSVLSFKDADSYMEKRVELGVQIVEQATIFVGYRKIDTDFETRNGGDYTYNDTGYIGFKIRF
jgi:hypothetical protein